ncbi:MAG: asparaginase [Dermatophilus congolensis]|nr:asparaginase [Dermatophilus congolensis]
MTRRIKVIYVGGTLGMVHSDDGLTPGAASTGPLAELLSRHDPDVRVDLHVFERLIDSAETTPQDWQAIADSIRADAGYDGFVVLHGTDTMAFTAAALAFALTDIEAPIVITGAQLSIVEPGSDTPGNVTGALTAACSGRPGVAVFFDNVLLAGARATKMSSVRLDGFASPDVAPLARVVDGRWVWSPPEPRGQGWPAPAPYRSHDIAVLTSAPGLTPERMRAAVTPHPEAVLIRAYGSGQVPGHGGATTELVRELVEAGVPVSVVTQSPHGPVDLTRYEAGGRLLRGGAHGVGDMILESAYTKLMFLLSQGVAAADIPGWMTTNLAGEVTPE